MKYQFKTNINCGNCVNTITPFLNSDLDIERWEVDTNNPDKILTVETALESKKIVSIVLKAGYSAELIQTPK